MVKKSSKKEEAELNEVVAELTGENPEPTVEDLDEGKISYGEIIAILCELPKDDFRKVVKIARSQRRTQVLVERYFGGEDA